MKRTWTKAMATVALTAGMLMTSVSAGFAGVSGRDITPYTADTTQTSGAFMELQDSAAAVAELFCGFNHRG